MKMNKFIKCTSCCTSCVLFVIIFALYAVVPAFALDIAYIDEHGAEGEKLWEAYKTALEPLKSDKYPEFAEKLDKYSPSIYSPYHEKITKKPQAEFDNLSTYDKTLIASTFIEPYYVNDLGQTFNSDMEWSAATSTFSMMFDTLCRDDSDNMKLAYNNLMYWQYQYYQSSGAFYNFVEGMDSLDYLNENYIEDMHKETEDSVSSTISSTITSPSSKVTSSSPISSDKRGIWENVKDNVKSHILTIVLLLAFLIAGAVIAIRKKRINAQDNDVQ